MSTSADPAPLPSERRALAVWLWFGAIGFGGPAGQIAIMHRELVERRRWLSDRRFLRSLSFCMALPGPEAMQLAAYSGYTLYGVRGAMAAGGLFILPGAVLMTVLSYVYVTYGDVTAVTGVVHGLTIAVVAVVLAAVIRIGSRVLHGAAAVPLLLAAFASILAGAPFPVVIAAAAGAGIAIGRTHPSWLGRAAEHAGEGEEGALPTTRRPAGALRRRIAIALAVWLVPVAAVIAYGGVWGDLAWFFTAAALITFGGAYAVLPFVAGVAVSHFGWLTANQMVAGLGLGETTPGPLILVNTFVGYLAGYHAVGSTAGGVAGAAVATYATFAPSFVFILAGAPLVDRIPERGPIADALLGVTVAVVGVIAGLAVYVGRHVLVVNGSLDLFACTLAAAAFATLRWTRLDVPAVIGLCALAGLVHQLAV